MFYVKVSEATSYFMTLLSPPRIDPWINFLFSKAADVSEPKHIVTATFTDDPGLLTYNVDPNTKIQLLVKTWIRSIYG